MIVLFRLRPLLSCSRRALLLIFPLVALLAGCSTYHVPGERADLAAFASGDIAEAFQVQASNPWPANIAAVRVQGPGYANRYLSNWNGIYAEGGPYSVITVRELDEDTFLRELGELPSVQGITGLNRMLLPRRIETDRDLRLAAAKVRADLLFLYTFDTKFYQSDASKPLTVISFGLMPTRGVRTVTTASAILLDTRTGFVYSTYEITEEKKSGPTTSWGTAEVADKHRQQTEKAAFEALLNEVVESWPALVEKNPSREAAPLPPLDAEQITAR
jgi:hypothetical protein